MNRELIEILTCIRIWSLRTTHGCKSHYFYDSIPCTQVNCFCCTLFQSKDTSVYTNKLVKVFSL